MKEHLQLAVRKLAENERKQKELILIVKNAKDKVSSLIQVHDELIKEPL